MRLKHREPGSFNRFSFFFCVLLFSGCAGVDNAAALYDKAQKEEKNSSLELAEKAYIACAAHSANAKSPYYQLASVNRLTELEKRAGNHSRSRTYMNQAATIAETLNEKTAAISTTNENQQLDKEKHIAIMRLADSLYEDGNFVSAKRLYEQAADLEERMKEKPGENSAVERIKLLDRQAKTENEDVSQRLSVANFSGKLRGPKAAQRSDERHKSMVQLSEMCVAYMERGDKSLAPKLLAALEQMRTTYGFRENEYRRAYKEVTASLVSRSNFALVTPLLEKDMKMFSSFSQADLESAVPEAVDNATFYTQDLMILALMKLHQKRHDEMLEICQKIEKLAPRVIPPNSLTEAEFLSSMALALERTGKKDKALPYRERQMRIIGRTANQIYLYAFALSCYAQDLIDVGRLEDAEKAAEELLRLKRTMKKDSLTIPTYVSYAELLIRIGKNEKARQILLEAIPLCEAEKDKSTLLKCYVMLSSACATSRVPEALLYARRAEDVVRKYGDYRQQSLAKILHSAATYEVQLGRNRDAIRTLDRGIAWQMAHDRANRAITVELYNLKAVALGHLNDWPGEKAMHKKAIELCRQLKPQEPIALASTLAQAAGQCQINGELGEAEKYFREAVETLKGSTDPGQKQSFLTYKAALGTCLAQERKGEPEAQTIKDEILPIYKSNLTRSDFADFTLCLCTAELCAALNDTTNQKLLMQEADSIYKRNKGSLKLFEKRMERQHQSLKAKRA